jgi:pimeloyl-ACP methyl ester carboxylesterase
VSEPERLSLPGRAGDLAALLWPGTATTGLYLAHANGFCKEVWYPVVDHLRESRIDADVVAWDALAHGESEAGSPPYDWWDLGEDVLSVVSAFEHTSRIGVGHSMGAAALVMAEVNRPGTFDGLVLIEPITFPPPFGRFDNPLVVGALRRRRAFPSQEAALAHFAEKEVFERWDDRALQSYASAGLHLDEGEWVLRCKPEHEADFFRGGAAHGAYEHLSEIESPVLLLAGEASTSHDRSLIEDLDSRLAHSSALIVPEAGHFLPMEKPEHISDLILGFLDGIG